MAWAAGCGWNPAGSNARDLPAVVDRWLAGSASPTFGSALQALGDAHRAVVPQLVNQSILTAHLYRPSVHLGFSPRTRGLTDDDLAVAASEIDQAAALAQRATLDRPDSDAVTAELVAAATLLALLVDDARARLAGDGSLDAVSGPTRRALGERLVAVTEEHRELWLRRARPGGLDESVAVFDRLAAAYASPPSRAR